MVFSSFYRLHKTMFDDDNCKNHSHHHLYLYHKLRFKSEFRPLGYRSSQNSEKVLSFKFIAENNEVIILRKCQN